MSKALRQKMAEVSPAIFWLKRHGHNGSYHQPCLHQAIWQQKGKGRALCSVWCTRPGQIWTARRQEHRASLSSLSPHAGGGRELGREVSEFLESCFEGTQERRTFPAHACAYQFTPFQNTSDLIQELLELGASAVWHTTVSAMPCDDTEAGAKWHGFDAMHWCCGLPRSLQTSPWFRMVECF